MMASSSDMHGDHERADLVPQKLEGTSAPLKGELEGSGSKIDHPTTKEHPKHRSLLLLFLICICLAGLAGYLYLPDLYQVSTDDASVDAHIVSVVPKVAAYVTKLNVDDNSKISAGDLLVELDARDFQVAVDSAKADLEVAQTTAAIVEAQLSEQQAIIVQSEATIAGDRATLEFAQQEVRRYGSLATSGFGPVQRLEQAQSDIGERKATLQRDLAALDAARAHVNVLESQHRQALASIDRQRTALAQAELNLSYTRILSPETGTVTNKTIEAGNFVQPGQTLFSIVPNDLYIVANYKETQLTKVRPGQSVTIRIDAFPDLRLRGHVDSIQRGTGSRFALLPPENATGNFVKVVQRVPVKIMFDDPGKAKQWISPGMSVETTIEFAPPPRWLAWLQ